MYAYINGDLVPFDQASVSIQDRGFILGDGVFETLYYDGKEIECLKPHYDRLMKGLALFQLPFDWVVSEFKAIIHQVIEANGLCEEPVAVRITCTRGVGPRGIKPLLHLHPTIVVTVSPYRRESKTYRVGTSTYLHHQSQPLSGIKHLGYQLSVLGAIEAQDQGLDDVLFFNPQGHLVCSTVANVFIIRDGKMITPPLIDSCLPGVMRGKIIQEMQKSGTPIQIDHITRHDVEAAKRIFLTNSLIGLQEAVFCS
jgi:branched-chain amino acid aminotransferase